MTYSVSNLPIGMVFDPIGRNISGTPVSAGTFTVGYHAFNGTNTGSTTFDIIVRPISLIAPAMVNYG